MRIFRFITILSLGLAANVAGYAATSAADAPHVHVELLAATAQATTGPLKVALRFELDPGWHVYWRNPGDAGEPVRVSWKLPSGVTAGELQYMAPKRLALGPLVDYGYENEAFFPAPLRVDPSVKPGSQLSLAAKVSWIVCESSCIPGHAQLDLTLPVVAGRAAANPAYAALEKKFARAVPRALPAGAKASFAKTAEGFRLTVETGRRETQASFFPADQDIIDNPAPQRFAATATGFTLDIKKDASLKQAPKQLRGLIELGGGRVYEIAALMAAASMQDAAGAEVATAQSASPAAPAAGNAPQTEPAQVPQMSGTTQPTVSGSIAALRAVGLAFLGGLLLNLMPCVFPVLFLKGLALVRSGTEERRVLRLHGLVYAAGILVSFWALVAALVGLRAAGATLGWGFQFQSPVFLSLMAGLLFFLGLSLAGQFEIGLTLTSAGGSLAAKQGYTGSFFTGVLAVIVATPCTAPFMGAAIGYALAASTGVVFAVFTAIALGLAAPYVALTLQPAWTRWLPRPGVWMEILRQAVAVPIFATVVWLVWVVAQAYGANLTAALLAGFVLLAVAGWFLGRWPARRWATLVAAVVLLAFVVLCVMASQRVPHPGPEDSIQNTAVRSANAALHSGVWQMWSEQAVKNAQAEGRPVFVDFTASWCLACQVNERVALTRPEVEQAFAAHNVVLLKADWTRHDETITRALAGLGRSGVPTYALYLPQVQESPRLLPEALTPGMVLEALKQLPR